MGRRNTRKLRNAKQLKIRYALFPEGLVTERQYLELLRQHLRPRHATFLIKPALHNSGCSWGLNPPVSRSARVM